MPGCRVVVATVLRDPLTLYPSLQRHQYYPRLHWWNQRHLQDRLQEAWSCGLWRTLNLIRLRVAWAIWRVWWLAWTPWGMSMV